MNEGIVKEQQTQSIHCTQYDISHHIPWQKRKIGCLHSGYIHELYCYLEIIGAPTILTPSGQQSRHFYFHIPSTMIQQLSSQLLQLSAWDGRVFANYVKRIGYKANVCIIRGPKFLPPSLIRNMNKFVSLPGEEKLIQQESVTANLQQLASNPGPLLPKPVLWFHLSWGDLIILSLIMVMLRFVIHIFQLNLTLNLFQIQTPLQSIQWVLM